VKTNIDVTIPYSEFIKLFPNTLGTTNTATAPDSGSGTGLDPGGGPSPGWISGLGIVPDWVVRGFTRDALDQKGTGVRAVIYDDATGQFLAATSMTYRPNADLTRHIRYRDVVCRFPGCRQPAKHCDIDHVHPWDKGGDTAPCNLMCLCRHHHRLKQNPAWRIRLEDGYTYWTTRTGHTYVSEPHDYRDRTLPPPKPGDLDEPPEE
jgi:hypothetical protein